MRKQIRFLNKTLDRNFGCVCLFCVIVFIALTYLFYLTPFLKNLILNESTKWRSFRTSSSKPAYISLELETKHYKHCGMKMKCSSDAFPVHLYTGVKNEGIPQICINEKKLPANRIGRGFNVAIVSNTTLTINRLGHFDIFTETSDRMEIFLEVMNVGDIVVIVTHDEASTKLSAKVRSLLNELGSAYIQDLDYRDVWVFVGQKGINGFSSYEHIEYLKPRSIWPKPIQKRFCIPKTLIGTAIRSDPVQRVGTKMELFCAKSNFKKSFCSENTIEDSNGVATTHNITRGLPIVIVPGPDGNIFRMQAEALLFNRGINLSDVHVFCPEDELHIIQIAQFLKFKIHYLETSSNFISYADVLHRALRKTWELFHSVQYFIIIEEGVIPSNDFLSFMRSARQILQEDASLIAASAWNGKSHPMTGEGLNFSRVNLFPGLGVLMRQSTFEKHLKNKFNTCCNKSFWEGWNVSVKVESVVPRISRAFKVISLLDGDPELFKVQNTFIKGAFSPNKLENVTLPSHSLLAQEISSCTMLSNNIVMEACLDAKINLRNDTMTRQMLCICYEQGNASDLSIPNFLRSCFENNGSLEDEDLATGIAVIGDDVFAVGSLSTSVDYLPRISEVFTSENVKAVEKMKRFD